MSIPVFLMVEATPNPDNREALSTYLSQVPSITREYGGIPIASYDVERVLDNDDKAASFAVLSFPSRQHIDALFDDPSYQALIPERDQGFSHLRYYVVSERI